ncbi:MAG: tetratricopeptide repeat protein [Promethearchaeota archaeon]
MTWNRPYLSQTNLCLNTITKSDVHGLTGEDGGYDDDGIHTADSLPTISITKPTAGSTVEGTVKISATASDDIGVNKVEFYIDSYLENTDTSSPYSYNWDTTIETNGEHTLKVIAYDTIDQVAEDEIKVIVQNFAKISITSLELPSEVITGEEFTVYATIVHSGTIDAEYVRATINLPASMVLTSGYETQTVGTIPTGSNITVSWNVKAQKTGKTTSGVLSTPTEQTESINVTVTSDNAGSTSENGNINVKPSLTYQIIQTSLLGIPILAFVTLLIFVSIVAFFSIRHIISRRDLEDNGSRRSLIPKIRYAISRKSGVLEQGLDYFEQGNYTQAIESFEQVVKIKPGLEDAWYFMGLAYEELGDLENAVEAFETVVKLDLERVDAWNHLGRSYFTLDKLEKALECLENVVRLTPEDAAAWYGMATICKALDLNTKAENYFEKAVEIDPRYSEDISWPEELPEISSEDLMVEPSEIISCPFCSETIPSGIEKCPTCGEKAVKCPICTTPIEFGDEFVKCPHCNTMAHRSHLLEWIKIKGVCPVCRKILKDIDIIS